MSQSSSANATAIDLIHSGIYSLCNYLRKLVILKPSDEVRGLNSGDFCRSWLKALKVKSYFDFNHDVPRLPKSVYHPNSARSFSRSASVNKNHPSAMSRTRSNSFCISWCFASIIPASASCGT
jgi:hypothetical protein